MAAREYPGDCEFTGFLLQRAAKRKQEELEAKMKADLRARAAKIRLLLLDVDGVLTDGSIVYTQSGDELKSFNSRDGFGLNLLRKAGVETGVITARRSEAVTRRAEDLGFSYLRQGERNKVAACMEIVGRAGLGLEQVAYMGDDWLDLPLLSRVGLAATVADGDEELKKRAHFISSLPGGRGAVRELCDLIIEARGRRDELLLQYLERQ